MLQLVNTVAQFGPDGREGFAENLQRFISECGCSGAEMICDGSEEPLQVCKGLAVGYHMLFYADWLDFWLGNRKALNRKFGSEEVWREFYGGNDRNALLRQFHDDLLRAEALGVKYVVFHVSDVSIEESFAYRWEHGDDEVIDAAAELVNLLLDGQNYKFEFLMENLHWPGFTFANPESTGRLLNQVHYERKGIMLDTGHLMCTNPHIRNQEEGCRYIHRMLEEHGELSRFIRGVHLHQSVSGGYVEQALKNQPKLKKDYYTRFAQAYDHIGKIDTHQPFDCTEVRELVVRIGPEYLVHEISAKTLQEKKMLVRIQQEALKGIGRKEGNI